MEQNKKELLKEKIFQKYGEQQYEILYFKDMREEIQIKCLNCQKVIYLKYAANFFKKERKNFCPYCKGIRKQLYSKGDDVFKISVEDAQLRLDEKFYGEYEILKDDYKGWSKRCLIKHTLCGKIFKQQPRNLLYHSHCPCFHTASKGEERIKEFLTQKKVSFISQYRFGDMKKAPYDFYLPKYNLLIEFQGRQHFEPVKAFGGEKQFERQKEIDLRKKENAIRYKYNIFYINYKEMQLIEKKLIQRLSLVE